MKSYLHEMIDNSIIFTNKIINFTSKISDYIVAINRIIGFIGEISDFIDNEIEIV